MHPRPASVWVFLALLLLVPPRPDPISVPVHAPANTVVDVEYGLASFYGRGFHGRRTASGLPFDAGALVAAHPVYPFGTVVRVTNISNGKSVDVRIVDRGPARGPRRAGVIIDVSRSAAEVLDFVRDGRTRVRVSRMRVSGTGQSAPGAD